MEVARKLLVVYYNNYNCLKKVANYGNLVYYSKKLKYAYLYVDEKKLKSTIENLKHINSVNKVEVSLNEIEDFSFKL